MKYEAKKIGKTILNERTKLGLSQAQLGQKLHIVGKQISNYENGKTIPPIETMLELCDIFNCELGYLLNEPDYSDKTKLETAIVNKTGLNIDALNIVQKITGTARSCLNFGYESESYRKILNSLILSDDFINCMECIFYLDNTLFNYKNIMNDLEIKIGKKRLNDALALRNSIDYSDTALTDEQTEDLKTLESAIDKQYDLEYSIKIARYELHEAFDDLINNLYPVKK